MKIELEKCLKNIPSLGQRQDGNLDQIFSLIPLAERLGLTAAVAISNKLIADASPGVVTREVPQSVSEIVNSLEQMPESELEEREQLQWLRAFANKVGHQDAADTFRVLIEHPRRAGLSRP